MLEELLGAVFSLPSWETVLQSEIAGLSCEMSKAVR